MFSENQGIIITVLLVVTICVIALIAVVYTFITTFRDLDMGTVHALEPDREVKMFDREVNYNFALPQEEQENTEVKVVEDEDEDKNKYYINRYLFLFRHPHQTNHL